MPKRKILSAKQQAVIDQFAQSESPRTRNISRTIWALINEKYRSVNEKEYAEMRRFRRFANLSNDQLNVICWFGTTSQDGLHAPDCIGDGIFRRFANNSPLEFALRLSIGARFEWVQVQYSANNQYETLFRPILQATAARDFEAAERLASLSPPEIETPVVRAYSLIFMGVSALIRGDQQLLQQATKKVRKSDPAYVKSILAVLRAVAMESAIDFANALNKMLSSYGRYMYNNEIYRLIDPHALGLYELCKRFSPSAVTEFDVERKLPWDREYYQWSLDIDDVSVYFDVDAIPQEMRPYLLEFQPIPWGSDVKANWGQ